MKNITASERTITMIKRMIKPLITIAAVSCGVMSLLSLSSGRFILPAIITSDDYLLGTLLGADSASRTLIIINSCEVIGNGNRSLRTIPYTKSASDTSRGTYLHHFGSLCM